MAMLGNHGEEEIRHGAQPDPEQAPRSPPRLRLTALIREQLVHRAGVLGAMCNGVQTDQDGVHTLRDGQ